MGSTAMQPHLTALHCTTQPHPTAAWASQTMPTHLWGICPTRSRVQQPSFHHKVHPCAAMLSKSMFPKMGTHPAPYPVPCASFPSTLTLTHSLTLTLTLTQVAAAHLQPIHHCLSSKPSWFALGSARPHCSTDGQNHSISSGIN